MKNSEIDNNSIEVLKKAMPFTQYGRYAIVRDIINGVRKKNEIFSVLDIGGRGNNLVRFLGEDKVHYLDPNIESTDDNFIVGDGRDIPLEGNSFDWVVSVDVFEHIPPEDRDKFLAENLRVAKVGVILVAPFNVHGVHEAEIFVNECFKIMSEGKDHVWLKEHIQNGLPEPKLVERYLEAEKISWKVYENNQLKTWKYYMAMTIGLNEQIESTTLNQLAEDIQYYYNDKLYVGDNGSPSYRKAFLTEKDASRFNSSTYSASDHNNDADYEKIIEKTVLLYKEIAKSLIDTNKEHVQNQKIMQANIDRLESDINNIVNSKWWKLRGKLLKAKGLVKR